MIMVAPRRTNGRCSKGWRRYRNYIFIVITMILITMQVYLYHYTSEVVERSGVDDAGADAGVASNVPANEDGPGRRLNAVSPFGGVWRERGLRVTVKLMITINRLRDFVCDPIYVCIWTFAIAPFRYLSKALPAADWC